MKTVKIMLSSVIALTLTTAAFGEPAPTDDIVGAVEADLRAIDQAELESEELDVDELVAEDKSASKPLELRKSQPLAFADDKPSSSLWWKLILSAGIATGGLWMFKRRMGKGAVEKTPALDVICRKSVGVRSEICIVTVDGHRLLLGITPNSIQRLASLPDPDETMTLAEAESGVQDDQVENGFGAVLKGTYARLAQAAEDRRVAKSVTLVASELDDVPPPESSKPRVIVRDAPTSSPRRLSIEVGDSQACSLRAELLRRKAS